MTLTQLSEQIGKRAVYVAQTIPAPVTVTDAKLSYGKVRFEVEDCQGKRHWANEESLSFVEAK